MPEPLQLIACQHSYWCGITRAHLVQAGVPFEEVLCTQEVMRKFLIPNTQTAQVPTVVDPNDGSRILIDTSKIFDYVDARYCAGRSFVPATPVQRVLCYLMETYANAWLIIPGLHYRWNRPSERPWLEAEWGNMLVPDAPVERRQAVARQKHQGPINFTTANGVTPATIPDIEASYTRLLAALDAHFQAHNFLLGGRASLADVALMGPLYGHLYRDPSPGLLMRETAPYVARWVERMNGIGWAANRPFAGGRLQRHTVVDGRLVARAEPCPDGGEFFAQDAVPGTLRAVVALFFDEHVPVLRGLRARFEEVAAKLPAKVRAGAAPIPRGLGFMPFRAVPGGAEGRRMMQPMDLWKLQRAADAYAALPGGDAARAEVDAFAAGFANGADLRDLLRARGHTRLDLRGGNGFTFIAQPGAAPRL